MAIKSFTIEELEKKPSRTDWKRVDALTDEEIIRAAEADPDNSPLTDDQLVGMRPAMEVIPEIVEAHRERRGSHRTPSKAPVSIRLNPEVADYFKSQGKGWQTQINTILREYAKSHQTA
ncbi:MAG: BrnA antitoxin family protein [Candidatus Latescibacteria bacterium]|nr:BrnA antitoxin family protein [Candidatus Latescibacterota bacterium]